MTNTHAHRLQGMTLENGMQIVQKIPRSKDETGGNFSVQYIAIEPSGEKCFLKAIDIEKSILSGRLIGVDFAQMLQKQMECYNYERQLLELCEKYYTSNIVKARASDLIYFNDTPIPVPYLTFDLADGNIKQYINFHNEIDFVWKLKSLHDVFVGVEQLHNAGIIHQDLKPSNIVQFKDDSKLTDLGRSKCSSIKGPYDSYDFSGDWTYAPIEVSPDFDFLQPKDWIDKNLAMDSYLLGNLMVYYFTGLNMSALLMSKLNKLGPIVHFGTKEEKKAYVERFFHDSIEEVRQAIEYQEFAEMIIPMIKELCNPDPNERTDKKTKALRGNQYALHRYITKLDVIHQKASLKLRRYGSIN